MEKFLSDRIKRVQPSQTLVITAKANELKAKGYDIISFGAGEPDFDTPDFVKEACIKALKEGKTRYTPSAGIPELREKLAESINKQHGTDYKSANVVITAGAKLGLYEIFAIILNEGDEVIVPSPYWVSYTEQIKLCDGKPVIVETSEENGFILTADILKKAITPKTKAVVINTPSNPTGAVIPKSELEKIAEVCLENEILIISDECYDQFCYETEHFSIASIPEVRDITFLVNAFSKSYSMTGWRLGWVACKEEFAKKIATFQSQTLSNPTSFAQYGGLAALDDNWKFPKKMKEEFKKRRDYIYNEFLKIEGVSVAKPEGAFYIFPNISAYIDGEKIKNDIEFTTYLLEEAKVAVVPGSAFGKEGYIRMSYATSMDNIIEGMNRIKDALSKLR